MTESTPRDEPERHHGKRGEDHTEELDAEAREYVYKVAASAGAVLIIVATVVYRVLEDWSWVDAFYFSAIAVTTVGFGDLAPSTDASKLFTVFYIFAGISLVGLVLNERVRRTSRRYSKRRSRRRG